jgi:hypothetical protein
MPMQKRTIVGISLLIFGALMAVATIAYSISHRAEGSLLWVVLFFGVMTCAIAVKLDVFIQKLQRSDWRRFSLDSARGYDSVLLDLRAISDPIQYASYVREP